MQLWFEHGYPRGVTLKRKDAKKSINKQALNKMHKTLNYISLSWISDYDMDEIVEEISAFVKDYNDLIIATEKTKSSGIESAIEAMENMNVVIPT